MSITLTAGKLRFVRYATAYPGPMRYFALAVLYLFKSVIITGGKGANTLSGGYIGLPRRAIVSTLQLFLAANSLKCEHALELSGNHTQPEDKSAPDDLAIATGLAAWAATNDFPELLLEVEGKSRNIRHSMDGEGPLC